MNADRRSLELAWDAFRAGTFPVGAVVLENGEIVAEGRNRIFDATPTTDDMWATLLAHAETNALSKLPVAHARPYQLVTSLEPCILCTGAAYIARVAKIRYLANDPYGGAAHMDPVNPAMDNAGMEVEGPIQTNDARLAGALPIVFMEQRGIWPRTREAFADTGYEALARRLLTKGRILEQARAGTDLAELTEDVAHLLGR